MEPSVLPFSACVKICDDHSDHTLSTTVYDPINATCLSVGTTTVYDPINATCLSVGFLDTTSYPGGGAGEVN